MFDFRNTYKNVVVLTGAGISAESGIATFRDSNGLWNNHKVEDVATPLAFKRNPKLVNNFYNQRRTELFKPEIQPNAAHKALAEFEKRHKGGFVIITQNVDDLHERAGSKRVLHMHGELLKKRCVKSGEVFPAIDDIAQESLCSCCNKKGTLRPHIVWFGEMPFEMDICTILLSISDLFVSIGTSGHVYPAAEFVEIARKGPGERADPLAKDTTKEKPARTVEINLELTVLRKQFDEGFYGKASEEVPMFFESLNCR
jgi:NAD-dependent protein deacetylase/lipoamidase